jgi:LysR family nitrogen assimilation transcriptional regulator
MDAAGSHVPELAAKTLLGLGGKPLELRELRCFLSVARTGNFGRAARELQVGQPAISHQMQKLEAGLGMQLLVRHARGVTLTHAGTRLRDRIDQVLQLLASPLDEAGPAVAQPGTVALAVPAELGPLLVTPLVEQFRALQPAVRLEIQEGTGAALEEWVLHRRADIAVVQDPSEIADLEIRPVLCESLGLVVSARSPLAEAARPLKLRDIAAQPLILPGPQHWIRRRLDQAAFQAGVQLGAAVQVDSVALTKAMVRNDLGCTVLPCTAVQDELARGILAFRPIVRPSLTATHAIAYRRTASPAAVTDLARLLHAAMVSLVESGAWAGAQVIHAGAEIALASAASLANREGDLME